jgi:hypothetical protein
MHRHYHGSPVTSIDWSGEGYSKPSCQRWQRRIPPWDPRVILEATTPTSRFSRGGLFEKAHRLLCAPSDGHGSPELGNKPPVPNSLPFVRCYHNLLTLPGDTGDSWESGGASRVVCNTRPRLLGWITPLIGAS